MKPEIEYYLEAPTCTEGGTAYLSAVAVQGGLTATAGKTVEVPALGHDYKDGVCTRCGAKDPNYVKPTAKSTAPDTGDDTGVLTWAVLLAIFAGALTMVLSHRRRRE